MKQGVDMMPSLALQDERIECEKVKQYAVLFDKQLEGYREKDVMTKVRNAVAKEIEIRRYLLFSRKNN